MSTTQKFKRISSNFIRGPQVVTARGLRTLAGAKKSVYHKGWRRMCPASFLITMPFWVVMDMIGHNNLFETRYHPLPRKKCPWVVGPAGALIKPNF